jgi:PAS domain S-box-containing protein
MAATWVPGHNEGHFRQEARPGSLRLSEERYRSIFETTGKRYRHHTRGLRHIVGQQRVQRLSGYTKEEIEARMQWSDFVEEADPGAHNG